MVPIKMQLYLEDEAPRIGAGWRLVYVRVGHKWVHLKEHGTNRTGRLTRKLFDAMKRNVVVSTTNHGENHESAGH